MCILINDRYHSHKLTDMQMTAVKLLTEAFTNHIPFKELGIDSSGVNESYELAVCDMLALCFDPQKATMDMKLKFAEIKMISPTEEWVVPKPQGSKRKKR